MEIYTAISIIFLLEIFIINESYLCYEVVSIFKTPTEDNKQQIIRNRKYLRLSIAEIIVANPLWLFVIDKIKSIGTLNIDNGLILLIASMVAISSVFHMIYWIPKITKHDETKFRSPYNMMGLAAIRFVFYLFFGSALLFQINVLLGYSPLLTIVVVVAACAMGVGIQKFIRIR